MKGQSIIAAVGDTHGHLQLACCVMAQWQKELEVKFEAVFLCGDVGTFTDESMLDSATRAHAKRNPCELEFLWQWSADPQAPWLDYIFESEEEGGLGLECPVVMVHGNHEGFEYLGTLVPAERPEDPAKIEDLPAVDTNGHLQLLPSGWQTVLPSGCVVAGVGGIDERFGKYPHPMAYVDDGAILSLLEHGPVDVLVTHQGPREVQKHKGSDRLQVLLDEGLAKVWFHGHSIVAPEPTRAGRAGNCLVVPLGDIAFSGRGSGAGTPGADGYAHAFLGEGGARVVKEAPRSLNQFWLYNWPRARDGRLVCPPLATVAW